jgi:LysR family transcriptional regulator, low CO2-responsive transcriptional regulator
MRYVQLRAFHHVAIHHGFSRAAKALNLTQPAVSDQVKKLEDEYDILLFDRHKRRVTITAQGERLLDITNRLFENERQALELLSESRAFSSGTLRIIADSAHHVTTVLSTFRERHPRIHISMRVGNTQDVMSQLYAYNADIGVLGEVPQNSDIAVLEIGATPLVAFAARTCTFDGLGRQSYQQLKKLPLVFREQGSKTRQKLEEAARKAGVCLTPAIEAEGREAVRELVASGAGIGFVSAAEYGQDERLFQIPLPDPAPMMQEALICLKDRSEGKLIGAFMQLAKEMFKQS